MSKNYYTVITGAKDNAGDFLIKTRATQLLTKLRPDRELVHFDYWDSLVDEKLSVVNNSKAVLLAGGPSVQTTMYPGVYKLCSSIDQIKVPVICLGAVLDEKTLELKVRFELLFTVAEPPILTRKKLSKVMFTLSNVVFLLILK